MKGTSNPKITIIIINNERTHEPTLIIEKFHFLVKKKNE